MDCNYIAFSNSPLDFFPNPPYNSGMYDDQKPVYTRGYEASTYPVLILPNDLGDKDGNYIARGYYEIVLSSDKKFLLFVQSKKLVAKVPVFKLEETEALPDPELDEAHIKKVKKKDEKRRRNAKPVSKPSNYFELRAKQLVGVELIDSRSYYTIVYKNKNIKAWGYFLK